MKLISLLRNTRDVEGRRLSFPVLIAAMVRFWSMLEALGPPTSNMVLAPGILSRMEPSSSIVAP